MSAKEQKVLRDRLVLRRSYVAPRTLTECELAEIWCAVLNMDRVGLDDDYVDLGGDSFLAVIMFELIAQKLSVTIPTATLLAAPTIAMLASEIDRARRISEPVRITPIVS